jgi:hypothetical protein
MRDLKGWEWLKWLNTCLASARPWVQVPVPRNFFWIYNARGVAQAVELLPCKHEALSSNSSTTTTKKKKRTWAVSDTIRNTSANIAKAHRSDMGRGEPGQEGHLTLSRASAPIRMTIRIIMKYYLLNTCVQAGRCAGGTSIFSYLVLGWKLSPL